MSVCLYVGDLDGMAHVASFLEQILYLRGEHIDTFPWGEHNIDSRRMGQLGLCRRKDHDESSWGHGTHSDVYNQQ